MALTKKEESDPLTESGGGEPGALPDRILAEATRLFSDLGVSSASMRMIAERLGVTKAALYYHFPSKDDLHFRIHLTVIEEVLRAASEIARSTQRPPEKVHRIVFLILDSIAHHRDEFTVLLREGEQLSRPHWEVLAERRERFRLVVRDVLVQGQATGDFVVDDPDVATLALLGMCNWAYTWIQPDGRVGISDLADAFTAIFLHGVGNTSGRGTT